LLLLHIKNVGVVMNMVWGSQGNKFTVYQTKERGLI